MPPITTFYVVTPHHHLQAERQRLSTIPGMLHPNELQEEMVDA